MQAIKMVLYKSGAVILSNDSLWCVIVAGYDELIFAAFNSFGQKKSVYK
jgi:hypothetical protein